MHVEWIGVPFTWWFIGQTREFISNSDKHNLASIGGTSPWWMYLDSRRSQVALISPALSHSAWSRGRMASGDWVGTQGTKQFIVLKLGAGLIGQTGLGNAIKTSSYLPLLLLEFYIPELPPLYLVVSRCRTSQFARCFLPAQVRKWNDLPYTVFDTGKLNVFKGAVNRWLLPWVVFSSVFCSAGACGAPKATYIQLGFSHLDLCCWF